MKQEQHSTQSDPTRQTDPRLASERLHSLHELIKRIHSGQPHHELLELVLKQACRLTEAQRGLVLLRSPEGDAHQSIVTCAAGLQCADTEQILEHTGSHIISEVLHMGTLKLIDDLASDKHYQQTIAPGATSRHTVRSVIAVPLLVAERAAGLLYLDHSEPAVFQQDDADFLTALASLLSLAMERDQSAPTEQNHDQTRHLAYLNQIGSALTRSLDLKHVLQVILESVNALLETERTSVFLIDEQTNELVLSYSNDGNADIRLPAPWQGIAGWVARHDTPTLVNDARNDPRHLRQFALDTGYEAHSILCVPLKVEGSVIGVVEVLNKIGGQPFTLYHQSLLTELTQWAAIALHNARLFDERVRAYQDLAAEQQRRIAAETRSAMAAVVLDMAHTMNNIIGAIRVWALTLEHESPASLPESTFKEMLERIRQNAEEAIDLIRTMRSPLDQAIIMPTDIHQCLEKVIKSCWWPDTIQLSVEPGDDVPLVLANPSRLEAVFQNVISNAIQALADETGVIHIKTDRTGSGWAEITINDNGPGIAPEMQQHLFTPGVSNREGRLGIGLWLVETFIHQFGGSINWSTTSQVGTTFIIILPPASPEQTQRGETTDAAC